MRDCSSPAALIVLAFALALHGTAAAQPPTAVSPQPAPHKAEEWRLAASNREAYVMDATGSVTGVEGATVAVRCVNPESAGFGTASARVPADAYRQRRVTLAAEVQTAGGPIAPEAAKVLDAAITIVKEHALRADTVDWARVEPEVRAAAGGASKPADVHPAIQMLLERLGDNHSHFMPPAATSEFKSAGAQNPPADVRTLPDGVGYIGVPAYRGSDPDAGKAYARRAHEAIGGVTTSAACGWVVDLRKNGGGNMWPMLSGLRPLVGDGLLGAFERRNGESTKWTAADPRYDVAPTATLRGLESASVAVLTGPRTASSGEFVTIAFRGRPRTRSFGLPTAGLSTSNSTFPLPDGSMIVLTTAVGADRTGRRYGTEIEPDEVIDGVEPAWPGDDPTLSAAVRWLKQSSGCGTR